MARRISVLVVFIIAFVLAIALINFVHTNTFSYKMSNAIKLGGEFFLNNRNEWGFLNYGYNSDGKPLEEDNMVRQLASLWAVAKMYNYTQDFRYKELFLHGYEYLKNSVNIHSNENYFNILDWDNDSNIAYSAFAILSLLEMDGVEYKDYLLEKFSLGILNQQNPDGSFRTFFFEPGTHEGILYYPGEAMLALIKLYQYDPKDEYLQAVKRGFDNYSIFFREKPHPSFVSWQTQAYSILYHITLNRTYADFIFEMNDWLIEMREGELSASYLEGLIDAYEIAKVLNYRRESVYEDVILRNINITINNQIKSSSDKHLKGGFYLMKKGKIRIDYNQHALFALIKAQDLYSYDEGWSI